MNKTGTNRSNWKTSHKYFFISDMFLSKYMEFISWINVYFPRIPRDYSDEHQETLNLNEMSVFFRFRWVSIHIEKGKHWINIYDFEYLKFNKFRLQMPKLLPYLSLSLVEKFILRIQKWFSIQNIASFLRPSS